MFKVNYIDSILSRFGTDSYVMKNVQEARNGKQSVFKIQYEHLLTAESIDFFTIDKTKIVSGGTLEVLTQNYKV